MGGFSRSRRFRPRPAGRLLRTRFGNELVLEPAPAARRWSFRQSSRCDYTRSFPRWQLSHAFLGCTDDGPVSRDGPRTRGASLPSEHRKEASEQDHAHHGRDRPEVITYFLVVAGRPPFWAALITNPHMPNEGPPRAANPLPTSLLHLSFSEFDRCVCSARSTTSKTAGKPFRFDFSVFFPDAGNRRALEKDYWRRASPV